MKYLFLLTGLFIFNIQGSSQGTEQLSQIVGYLEVYLAGDTTSVYIGKNAGQKMESGNSNRNVIIGTDAGEDLATGHRNVFVGTRSGESTITGFSNVFIGEEAGQNNVSGDSNVFIGEDAGEDESGSYNTYVGSEAGNSSDSTSYNSFFGYQAGDDVEGNYNVYMGALAGEDAEVGDYNTVAGYEAGVENLGSENSFFGARAGQNNQGDDNHFFGFESGILNTLGRDNAFSGHRSGYKNIDGSFNAFYGSKAGESNIIANNQTFLGYSAGRSNKRGANSVVIGSGGAFLDTSILSSVYIGYSAGQLLNEGGRAGNVFIGNFAGYNQNVSDRLFISNSGVGMEEALIYGEFDNDILRVNGDLHLAANAANGNTILRMEGVGGQMNEVIRYDGDTNDVIMGSVSGGGGKLLLRANGAPAMTILENGNVGIGNINPPDKFHVVGNGYFSNFVIAEKEVFINGMVAGAGTSDVRYNATTGRLTQSTSDRRLKENIKTIDGALDKITQLRGVRFTWKEETDGRPQLGLIAQEVKDVLPEVVSQNKNGYYGVDYTETIGVFVEAIKEQQEMIEELKEEIEMLKRKLEEY